MSASFDAALAFVLEWEGVASNHPDDPGGETFMGLSSRAHPDLDVMSLTANAVRDVYAQRYWHAARCPDLPAPLALPVFDGAVQHGVRLSLRLLQKAVSVAADGIVGPRTLAAVQAHPWGHVLVRYLAERALCYSALPHYATFALGWHRRLFAVQRAVYEAETQGG